MTFPHIPVMLKEVMEVLQPAPGEVFIDGTLGAGGHSEAILNAIAPDGTLTAFDLDPEAIRIATDRLKPFASRVTIVHDSYTSVRNYFPTDSTVDGFLADLGVSSMQIDQAERGFSFISDGPLDMRFSPDQKFSASDIVNTWDESEIARILWVYGEERNSHRIARAICEVRENHPIQTTKELAELIVSVQKRSREKIHPATRSFQAIRIAVNGELDAIEKMLPEALELLKPGGRMAVISFHSLEDRIVKQFFRTESTDCLCPPEQPVCTCGHKARLKEITRHPIVAEREEIDENGRARSAKLRAAEKIRQGDEKR